MATSQWRKPKTNNSPENIELFKAKLESSRKYVEELLMGKVYGEPKIVSGLDKLRQETAERVLEMQKTNGKIIRSEMLNVDMTRVREIQKKNDITFEEALHTLVENCVYQSLERQFAESYVAIIKDVEKVLNEYGDRLKVFPMNALSKESVAKLDSNQVGLSNNIKLKLILDTFVPGFMNLEIVANDYSVVAKKSFALSDDELASLAKDIKENFGDENGNIDKIFARENSSGLKKLIEALKRNNLTFEEFASRFGLNYTRCYNVPSVPAVKKMVDSYYFKYQTYRYIKQNDQYLFAKLASVRKQENMLSNEQMFSSWGLDTSEMIAPNNIITDFELRSMQEKLIEKLAELYPDKNIGENFSRTHKNTYRLANQLAKRLEFENIDSYLKSIGYHRETPDYRSTYKNTLCLSERDLMFYHFFDSETDPEQIEKTMKEMGITLASVEDYAGFYIKLAYEKCDALYHYASCAKKMGDV